MEKTRGIKTNCGEQLARPYVNNQTLTKMSPADAEDTLINNLFSSYLISGSPYHLQVSGLLGIALDLLTDVADMHRNGIVRTDSLHMPDRLIDLADG